MEYPPFNPEQDVSNTEVDMDNTPAFASSFARATADKEATEGALERYEAMAETWEATKAKTWEATKRFAQAVYESAGRGYEDIYGSIGKAYDQILTTGHLYPSVDMATLTREISEDAYKQPEAEQGEALFYLNHFHGHNPEPEQGIEPEV